jgi:hypothetical protein
MFKELNDNLKSIEDEVSKFKTAIEHIEQAKAVAEKTAIAADTLTKEFSTHLTGVTSAVDKTLKPHKELIAATKTLRILLFISIGVGIISISVSIVAIILK